MKKRIIIIIVIILLAFLSLYFFLPDNIKIKVNYEFYNYFNDGKMVNVDIPVNNKFVYANNKDLLELFKDGTGVVYFGYSTCPWCRSVVEILNEVVSDSSINKIYYYDTKSSNYNQYFKKNIIPYIDSYLKKDINNQKRLYVPDVYFIKNGKIVGHHIGSLEGHENPYIELNNKEKKELIKIYSSLLEGVID